MKSVPHQLSLSSRPLAHLALSFSAGIVVGEFVSLPLIWLLFGSGLAFFGAALALRKQRLGLAAIFVTIAFCASGAALYSLEQRRVSVQPFKRLLEERVFSTGDPVELTGILTKPPETSPQGLYLTLRLEHLAFKNVEYKVTGVVLLMAPFPEARAKREYAELELCYGARLRVMTALKRADDFRNPGVSSLTEYLEQKGFVATGVVKSPLLIERLDDEQVFLPLAWLYQWRLILEEQIHLRFSTETASVLDAALLGNRHYLSRETAERFREGGTFHVLVISGLHISFIGGVVFLLARRVTSRRSLHFILSITFLWGYALAVGAQEPVLRAALMFTVVAFAPIFFRHQDSLNILGGTALTLLVLEPNNLFNPSFQLTFLSVTAIAGFAWPILRTMSEIGRWRPTRDSPHPPRCPTWLRSTCERLFWSERQWQQEISESNYSYKLFKAPVPAWFEVYGFQRLAQYILGAIIVSLSVQLLLLPFLVLYFHRISIASIVLNIGVGVGMALTAAVALVTLLFAQISSSLASPLITSVDAIAWATIHSVDLFSTIGVASIRLPEYSGWKAVIYGLYYLPMCVLMHSVSQWSPLSRQQPHVLWRYASLFQVVTIAIILLHPFSALRADGKLHVNFLDVGQGDSIFVTMPDGTTLLVDGGGRRNFFAGKDSEIFEPDRRGIGEAVVSEFLWKRGLHKVDYIVATHAHADHVDGLKDVVRNFRVRASLLGRKQDGDPEFEGFAKAVRARRVPMITIGTGDVLRFGNVAATVLWPPPPGYGEKVSRNDDSVVLNIWYGEHKVLLTGDIERRAEIALVNNNSDLRADVVKVPHHGSRSSSTDFLVDATKPRFAIISVGQTSIFGHPDSQVVERWLAGGAEVLTTGRSGTITLTSDGQELELSTFVKIVQ